jgi:hypothetical protein
MTRLRDSKSKTAGARFGGDVRANHWARNHGVEQEIVPAGWDLSVAAG